MIQIWKSKPVNISLIRENLTKKLSGRKEIFKFNLEMSL